MKPIENIDLLRNNISEQLKGKENEEKNNYFVYPCSHFCFFP